jgi:hypothetical protein
MELIAVMRLLWRRRVLLVAGAVLAVGAAVMMGPSPTPPRGFAMTRVLLDTSRSQLAADAPLLTSETLPWRATLAAETLGTEANRSAIAARAGIRPDMFDITDITLTIPTIPASLPRAAAESAFSESKPYGIDVYTDDIVPLISISANAPTRAEAVRLAESTVAALRSYVEAPANTERMALSVRTTSPVNSVAIPAGHGRKKMAAIAVILVCMWIGAVALMPIAFDAARRTLRGAEPARF